MASKDLLKYHTKSLEYNLTRMFFSFTPVDCNATSYLKKQYPVINSTIPLCYLKKVCVIGRVSNVGEYANDVCVIGTVMEAVEYLLGRRRRPLTGGLLSVGIGFQSLTIYPRKAAHFKRRVQYVDEGYGRTVDPC